MAWQMEKCSSRCIRDSLCTFLEANNWRVEMGLKTCFTRQAGREGLDLYWAREAVTEKGAPWKSGGAGRNGRNEDSLETRAPTSGAVCFRSILKEEVVYWIKILDLPGGVAEMNPLVAAGFNPWSGRLPHATKQRSLCPAAPEPGRPQVCARRQKPQSHRSHEEYPQLTATRESLHEATKTQCSPPPPNDNVMRCSPAPNSICMTIMEK